MNAIRQDTPRTNHTTSRRVFGERHLPYNRPRRQGITRYNTEYCHNEDSLQLIDEDEWTDVTDSCLSTSADISHYSVGCSLSYTSDDDIADLDAFDDIEISRDISRRRSSVGLDFELHVDSPIPVSDAIHTSILEEPTILEDLDDISVYQNSTILPGTLVKPMDDMDFSNILSSIEEADIFDDILSFSEKEQSVVNTPEKIHRSVEVTQRATPGNQRIVIRTPGAPKKKVINKRIRKRSCRCAVELYKDLPHDNIHGENRTPVRGPRMNISVTPDDLDLSALSGCCQYEVKSFKIADDYEESDYVSQVSQSPSGSVPPRDLSLSEFESLVISDSVDQTTKLDSQGHTEPPAAYRKLTFETLQHERVDESQSQMCIDRKGRAVTTPEYQHHVDATAPETDDGVEQCIITSEHKYQPKSVPIRRGREKERHPSFVVSQDVFETLWEK